MPETIASTYEVIGKIGSGGGGIVYLANHVRLGKKVVLKADKRKITARPEILRREVDALKNLSHTYIPQVYDFFVKDETVYTVMDYIEGESFDKPLKRGERFSQPQVVKWARQLLEALCYLHNPVHGTPPRGIVHSDIKPANVMLTPHNDICLIDFNIALALGEENIIGRSDGYASPEHYGIDFSSNSGTATLGDTTVLMSDTTDTLPQSESSTPKSTTSNKMIMPDARSDIYSIGATLYHLVTGEKPAISTGEIKPLREFELPLSEAFIYIVERCMERDPSKRFQTADDLYNAIVNIHKLDGRWRQYRIKAIALSVILSTLLFVFSATTVFGVQRLGFERVELYNNLVLQIAIDETAYERAIVLFPEKPNAYREWALRLYHAGDFEETINYIRTVMASLSAFPHNAAAIKQLGDIQYISGRAFFAIGDYPNAILAFETAISNNPYNLDIYRDYAIALARTGQIDRAEELLTDISDKDMGVDSLNLLRGEIAFARGNYLETIELLRDVIRTSNDQYIRSRAYIIADRAYRRIPHLIENNIALLREAVQSLPANHALVLKERLADALVRNGNYNEAITLFEEILQRGNISYQTKQNIGVLYQRIGNFSQARIIFNELSEMHPNDYRPPMRLAFLVLEEQSRRPNHLRDYQEIVGLYARASELHRVNDMEMQQLSSLVAELRRNGWIR